MYEPYLQTPDEVPTLESLPEYYRPEAPEVAALRQKILEAVAPHTREAPPALTHLKPRSAVRQLVIEPQKLLALLSESFTDHDLVASGVALRRGDQLTLSAVFGTPETSFCWRYHEKMRNDAASARGVLSGTRRELARLSREFGESLSKPKPYVLAVDEREARFLGQLRFNVTSAAPLQPVCIEGVRPLIHVRPRNHGRAWELVVAFWDPAALKNAVRPLALALVEQLAELARSNDLDVGLLIRAWCPSAADVAGFRRAYRAKDLDLLTTQFTQSLSTSSYPPEAALTLLRDRTPVDFESARRRTEHAVHQSSTFPRVGEAEAALASLARAFERQVLSRFSDTANGGNPWEALANPMAAQYARDWFDSLDVVAAARLIRIGKHPESGGARDADFLRRLQLADAFAKLHPFIGPRR